MRYPKLLILDEPTTGLDFILKRQLFKTLGKHILNDSQLSVIHVTHIHIIEEMPLFVKKIYLKTFTYLTRVILKIL